MTAPACADCGATDTPLKGGVCWNRDLCADRVTARAGAVPECYRCHATDVPLDPRVGEPGILHCNNEIMCTARKQAQAAKAVAL